MPTKPRTMRPKTAPQNGHEPGSSFNYKYLSVADQLAGLRNRAAQLEAEHMSQRLRRLEVAGEVGQDDALTEEMVNETYAAIDKTLASIDRRRALIEQLISEYEEVMPEEVQQ